MKGKKLDSWARKRRRGGKRRGRGGRETKRENDTVESCRVGDEEVQAGREKERSEVGNSTEVGKKNWR